MKKKYDYYNIRLSEMPHLVEKLEEAMDNNPDTVDSVTEEIFEYAIDVARERTRIYAIPCGWRATWENEEHDSVRVTRIRNR